MRQGHCNEAQEMMAELDVVSDEEAVDQSQNCDNLIKVKTRGGRHRQHRATDAGIHLLSFPENFSTLHNFL